MTALVISRSKVSRSHTSPQPEPSGRVKALRIRIPRPAGAWALAAPLAAASRARNGAKAALPGPLDHAYGLQPGAGMDLALAHHRRLAAEALDDRADVGADHRAGQQHRRLAGERRPLERLAHPADELLQARGRQRELPLLALADQGLGEGGLPLGTHGDDRQCAVLAAVGEAEL